MEFPKEIGARVTIPNNYDLKREYEAKGFWPETITPQHCVMRRDFADEVVVNYWRAADRLFCSPFPPDLAL